MYYSEKRRHAVFWSASCYICGSLVPLKATRIPNPQIPLETRGLQRTRNSRALTPAFREALVPLVPMYPGDCKLHAADVDGELLDTLLLFTESVDYAAYKCLINTAFVSMNT